MGKVLQDVFSSDYKEILSLAYYEIVEGAPGYLFPYWLQEQDIKGVKNLYSSDISQLHASIGSNQKSRTEFMRRWVKELQPIGGIYYDITFISGYSTRNDFVEWGYNRDGEDLAQINMGMVCCQERGLPFFYNLFPGSIVDVKTLKNRLKYLEEYQLNDLILVMDRGFFSTANILSILYSPLRIALVQPLSFSLKKAKELVVQNREKLKSMESAFKYNEEIIHHTQESIYIDNRSLQHTFSSMKITYLKNTEPVKSVVSKKQRDIMMAFDFFIA